MMSAQSTGAAVPIHLRAGDYKDVGGDDPDAEGLRAREIVGPSTSIAAIGPLVAVHDRRFAPRSGSERQPHRGMEQLFYVLEGTIRHSDSVERMAGTLHRGDLGILTEGREVMGHTERNDGELPARVYVMAYPASPMPDEASFQVIRDTSMPRVTPHTGVETKVLVERSSAHVHGQVHKVGDTRFEVGGALPIVLEPGEGALLFCLDGRLQVDARDATPATTIGLDETVLFAPAPEARRVVVDAQGPGRLLHAVTGTGFGFRLQDAEG
jgi:redox-sensitive bicupin YhaK (pirin superfamily)